MSTDHSEPELPDCQPAWSSRAGYLHPQGAQPVPASLSELADRYAIQDSVLRYSYAYDEHNRSALRELLTENATYAYTVSGSPLTEITGRDTLVAWLGDIMNSQPDQRRHIMTNVVIDELQRDHATVAAYSTLFSVRAQAVLVTTGFKRFELVKDADRWRIAYILDGLDRSF
jgi:hypothetical protein